MHENAVAWAESVLRLMTNEPWRTHGAELTRRERAAQLALAATPVPTPTSLGLDADGTAVGVAAHLMSRLPGSPTGDLDNTGSTRAVEAMAEMLAAIHDVRPAEPFRTYESWAWEAKRVVPAWTRRPNSWEHAFALLAEEPMFGSALELERLDGWLHELVTGTVPSTVTTAKGRR